MAGLVAIEANHKFLGAIPGDMPFLAIFVASTRSTGPLMTLVALPASEALLASSPRISGLGPLGSRLRLGRPSIHPLRLGLHPGLSLQLNLPLPSICLELSKCLVRRVRHELPDVPPQNTQIPAHPSLLSSHLLRAEYLPLMKLLGDHSNRIITLLEGQELLNQSFPLHRGNVLVSEHRGKPFPCHC